MKTQETWNGGLDGQVVAEAGNRHGAGRGDGIAEGGGPGRIVPGSEGGAEQGGLTKEEVVGMLVEIVRSTPDEATMDNPLCELKMSAKGPYAVFPDKFRAMERLSKMLGWEAVETKGDGEDSLTRLFGEIRAGR